jgi:broad specificity phosphatase PhoE
MTANAIGVETLNVIKNLQQEGIDAYVALMRHSARYVDTADNDESMGLTEEGKQAAYELGKALPANALLRFFSSPVGRCVETSSLIEQGYLTTGGRTQTNRELDALYAFYVRDFQKLNQINYDMDNKGEWARFFRNWFEGKYSPNLVDSPSQSAQTMLNALVDLLGEPMVGNICISHDWNLFLIKEYFLGLRPEDNEYIQYLEGVIIYEQNGGYYITNHQAEVTKLDTSGRSSMSISPHCAN